MSRKLNEGLSVDAARVHLLAFHLLNAFLADEHLAALRTGEYNSPPDVLFNEFAKTEIERSLIEIAILVRIADDAAIQGRTACDRWNPDVGTLRQPLDSAEETLYMRAACNKIIHATAIRYRTKPAEYEWNEQLEPVVELIGEENGDRWDAALDIKKFCFETTRIPAY